MSIKDIEIALKKRANALIDNSDYISESIMSISDLVTECIKNSGKIFFCGNGGSAAESQHMAAEYCATLDHHKPREGMPALALTTDTSFITAWSNDFDFKSFYQRQIEAFGRKGDLFILFSTSGGCLKTNRSLNLILAAMEAKKRGIKVIGFLGKNGGELVNMVDIVLHVKSESTAMIQQAHITLVHAICELLE